MADEIILNKRYRLVSQLGAGGMSVIYRALDVELQRTVAVKVLRPSLVQQEQHGTFIERFKNEARSVANLNHSNIVIVYDVGSDGQTYYMVMELVDGQDLKKIIKQLNGPMPIDRVLDIAIQVCDGIGYAHRSGLVHADIKPQNILVTTVKTNDGERDIIKVTDFGIAQALSDTQPQAKRVEVVWGSPQYFSPEQARGEQPTRASDIYSIGILLFEMLSGRLPYIAPSQQELALAHIKERIPMLTEANPNVPDELVKIVYRAMSKEAQARFRDGDQLAEVLRAYRNRARAGTMAGPSVPQVPHPAAPAPSAPPPAGTMPQTTYKAPAPVPPTMPPAPPPGLQVPAGSEPTARYSAVPQAPQPYHPRQAQQNPAPVMPSAVQAPQALEQRYAPPVPGQIPMPQRSDSNFYSPTYPSQAMPPMPQAEAGPDYVTIGLAIVAILAVLGLFPVWLLALLSR